MQAQTFCEIAKKTVIARRTIVPVVTILLRPALQMNRYTAKRPANSAGTAVFAAE